MQTKYVRVSTNSVENKFCRKFWNYKVQNKKKDKKLQPSGKKVFIFLKRSKMQNSFD